MPKRNLRVTKWLSMTPAVGVCTSCSREFKVPMTALSKTKEAQVNLQQQFEQHKCESKSVTSESEEGRAAHTSIPQSALLGDNNV
jgi:hypothetical protein